MGFQGWKCANQLALEEALGRRILNEAFDNVPILPLLLAALISGPHFCMWPHIVAAQRGRFFRLPLVNDLNEQTIHAFIHAFYQCHFALF